jgi:hypothetical protein
MSWLLSRPTRPSATGDCPVHVYRPPSPTRSAGLTSLRGGALGVRDAPVSHHLVSLAFLAADMMSSAAPRRLTETVCRTFHQLRASLAVLVAKSLQPSVRIRLAILPFTCGAKRRTSAPALLDGDPRTLSHFGISAIDPRFADMGTCGGPSRLKIRDGPKRRVMPKYRAHSDKFPALDCEGTAR